MPVHPSDMESYLLMSMPCHNMQAEVTGGGVRLAEVNCGTMESRQMPGVHIAGELLDVFGRIGGFNFYWAWLSGRLAGRAAAAAVKEQ